MPGVERVRAWADGVTEPHPDDAAALAECLASPLPTLRAAGATRQAVAHLAELRFEEARAASAAAVALLADPSPDTLDGDADSAQVACWAWDVHAEALDELGCYADAAASAQVSADIADAHRLDLAWARAVNRRMWIARQQGDAAAAAALLRQLATRLSPRAHLLCSALGKTLSWLGRLDSALLYTQRCLTLPGSQGRRARDHRDLAQVLIRLGRFADARRQLDLAATELAKRPPTLAGTYMLSQAEYRLAMACGDDAAAERIARTAAEAIPDPANLRRQTALLALGRAYAAQGRIDEMRVALANVEAHRLGAENRALALRLDAAAAESAGDWRAAAHALGQAREILAGRHVATPAVLLIEADLAVADPFAADLMPGGADGVVSEFNRALATRDQLLLAAAKDLRGPIGVFELGAELLADPAVDAERVATLVERGLAEMELLVSQLRDTELGAPGTHRADTARETVTEVVAAAIRHVAPIAASRSITVTPTWSPQTPAPKVAPAVAPAVTTALALAVRGASRGSTISVRAHPSGRIELELVAGDAAPNGWTALDSLTAATAGGPTAWRLAAQQLAEAGGALTAEWGSQRHLRVRVDPGA